MNTTRTPKTDWVHGSSTQVYGVFLLGGALNGGDWGLRRSSGQEGTNTENENTPTWGGTLNIAHKEHRRKTWFSRRIYPSPRLAERNANQSIASLA